tara:strand:- start:4940 stop:6679 length:1740 start_codon:yes stop_codon:yes gene_type:complete
MTNNKEHWGWFLSLWRFHIRSALFLIVLTLLSTVCFVGFPLFFRELIDFLLAHENNSKAMLDSRQSVLGILFFLGIVRFSSSLSPLFRAQMNYLLEKEVRERYFSIFLDQEPINVIKFRTGDLVVRFTDDLASFPKISWFACSGLFRAFNSVVMVVGCIVAMLFINPILCMFTLIPIPIVIGVYLLTKKGLKEAFEQNQSAISDTTNQLEACFSGIRILHTFNAIDRELNRFKEVLKSRKNIELNTIRYKGIMGIFYEFVSYFAQVLVVAIGGYMLIKQTISLGDFYAFYTFLGAVVYPMLDIPHLLIASRQAFACVDRLEELRIEPTLSSEKKKITVQSLALKNISFQYPYKQSVKQRDLALNKISLNMDRGQTLAVVGKVGSGKSTLLQLLAGVIKPQGGKLLINGNPVASTDWDNLRENLALVSQEPLVFSESVASNIQFFKESCIQEVEDVAKISQIHNEILVMPSRYSEILGQRGLSISGGQKQRLTISRALLTNPDLLLMDDVTSSLDAENESRFWADLQKHQGKKTIVVVTNRLETARNSDLLLVLKDGKVKDFGSTTELLRNVSSLGNILH